MLQCNRSPLVALLVCWMALSWLPASRAVAGVEPTKEFAGELEQSELVFDPAVFGEFSVARVLPNPHFQYSFSLKHRTLPFEVRFATRHVAPAKGIKQDAMVENYVLASVMNMAVKEGTGPRMVEPEPFDPDAVKAEFNADWGATSMIVPDPTFAKYESGLVNVIYRDKKKALGYLIFLYNGEMSDKMLQVFQGVFHAMRFRK